MLLLIDNYDSFTYNLVHYLGDLGAEVQVHRNDALDVQQAMALRPEGILLSPGPCDPDQAGICLDLTRAAAETLAESFGPASESSRKGASSLSRLWSYSNGYSLAFGSKKKSNGLITFISAIISTTTSNLVTFS